MTTDRILLGVLDVSATIANAGAAAKYRDLTVSWSRYSYRKEIIEATTVDDILAQAADRQEDWCLVLPYGHIIAERWTPDEPLAEDLFSALRRLMNGTEFLVAGLLAGTEKTGFGFDGSCCFVNLPVYRHLGAPEFGLPMNRTHELPGARAKLANGQIEALSPSGEFLRQEVSRMGWNLIATSIRNKIPVPGFDQTVRNCILQLSATNRDRTQAFAKYLNEGIAEYCPENPDSEMGQDQIKFLNMVQPQTCGARQGVFLWNIESYDDIEHPAIDFAQPLNCLYSVAAGFKPNRILHTHGWNESTRVVFYDYSAQALKIREFMIRHWDGRDFPDFVHQLFERFPYPDTFYQLWDKVTPNDVTHQDLERMWLRELDRWGGAFCFQEHWRGYRELQHEYVCCNILTQPMELFERIVAEPRAVIWFSNAFFTVYGNWFYSLDQRQQMFEDWMGRLVQRNPDLLLYGSDYNNVNINSIRANDYWEAYRQTSGDCLRPVQLARTEMRM